MRLNGRHHLRENLTFECTTMQWRQEDVARSKFRLSLVLQAQNRPSEAGILRREAQTALEDLASASTSEKQGEPGDDQDKWEMERFDLMVALWHGRTTGLWSDGEHW